MALSYSYSGWRNWQWHQHVPLSLAISMVMGVRRCNTKCIAQSSMSRATPEATGYQHGATTCSILPQRPPGQQANKQQSTNTPTKLAVLKAMAMRLLGTSLRGTYVMYPYRESPKDRALGSPRCCLIQYLITMRIHMQFPCTKIHVE